MADTSSLMSTIRRLNDELDSKSRSVSMLRDRLLDYERDRSTRNAGYFLLGFLAGVASVCALAYIN